MTWATGPRYPTFMGSVVGISCVFYAGSYYRLRVNKVPDPYKGSNAIAAKFQYNTLAMKRAFEFGVPSIDFQQLTGKLHMAKFPWPQPNRSVVMSFLS